MSDETDASSLEIVHYPAPVLRREAEPVRAIDDELEALVDGMRDLLHEAHGVGLAAPQVGRSLRLFLTCPEAEPGEERVFINPAVVETLGPRESAEEGCLSIPGVSGTISRPARVRIRAWDLEGEEIAGELDGLAARVYQHELDHLDGVLIIDKMRPSQRHQAERQLEKLARAHHHDHGDDGSCACPEHRGRRTRTRG